MRIDLQVLSSVDQIITTSTSDSECVSGAEEQMLTPLMRGQRLMRGALQYSSRRLSDHR